MAPHSRTLAWKIPWIEEPGGLQSMGSLRVRHDWVTPLSIFTFHFHALEKEMATHSGVLAWRIPGTVEPGGLPSMGSRSQTRLKRPSSSSSSSQQLCAKYWQYVGRGKTVSSSLINSLSHSNDIFPLKSSCLISSLSLTIKKAFHSCLFFSAHHLFSL